MPGVWAVDVKRGKACPASTPEVVLPGLAGSSFACAQPLEAAPTGTAVYGGSEEGLAQLIPSTGAGAI